MGRLLRLTVVMLVAWSAGCTSTPAPLKKLPLPFAGHKEQALRKQVEADSFPTAQQAGL
jgi:hypothetical protein